MHSTYREERVEYLGGMGTLAGSIFVPDSAEPSPGVVLIHGSGPQNRNGDLGLLRLHAEQFAARGIAALIYDKRGAGGSAGTVTDLFEPLADDALSGASRLYSLSSVDPTKVGLWGISQGSWIAPLAAARSPEIAFLVLVSAPAVSIAQQNVENIQRTLRVAGFPESDVRNATSYLDLFHVVLATGERWDELTEYYQDQVAQAAWAQGWGVPRPGEHISGPPPPGEAEVNRRELYRDPLVVLRRVRCPVLAIYGAEDTITSAETDRRLLETALREGGNDRVTTFVLPEVHHELVPLELSARRYREQSALTPDDFRRGYFDMTAAWIRDAA